MLRDLNKLALEAKTKRDSYANLEIKLNSEFKTEFLKRFPHSKIEFHTYTCVDYTPQGLSVIIPNQWFIIASFFTDYLKSLFEYKKIADNLKFTSEQIKHFRDSGNVDSESLSSIKSHLTNYDSGLFVKFLTDYEWWFGSKTVDRSDFFVSSVLNLASVVHVAQGYIAALTQQLVGNEDLIDILTSNVEEALSVDKHKASLKSDFAQWLVENRNNNYFNNDGEKTIKALSKYEEKYGEEFGYSLFEIDINNIDGEIHRIREDIWNEDSAFWQFSKTQSTHQPRAILGDENYLRFLQEFDKSRQTEDAPLKNGFNKIYFGAPGTGKSYKVAQEIKDINETQVERVTFHPDYDYASFVGGYKPVTEQDDDGNDIIRYKFVPQVFINIYERAHRNPSRNYYLVIEEVNRGNCAEIFGDIFQLLDRNPDYAITPSEDLMKHLQKRDQNSTYKTLKNGKMIMPNNLIILATMNTSDQSLFPMDSAFKRRWEWEYVPIKYPVEPNDTSCPSFSFRIQLGDGHYFNWMDFVAGVNRHILENPSLGLDKCIGNFFTKPDAGNLITVETTINKVIFYLWNDVFKDEENEIFADHTYLDYFPVESNGVRRLWSLAEKFGILREIDHEDLQPDEVSIATRRA